MPLINTTFAAPLDDFVVTVKSDNTGASANDQFIIPTAAGGGYNYNVDCDNDGTDEFTAQTGNVTCNFTTSSSGTGAGTYTIRIKDNSGLGTGFHRIYFTNAGDKDKIIDLLQWGTGKWSDMGNAFFGCSNLLVSASDSPDLSGLTNMSSMFSRALIANPDVSLWDTSNITTMFNLFEGATMANPNVTNWNTFSVIDMSQMFFNASAAYPDVSSWDTGNVMNFSRMFRNAPSNPNVTNWDTSSAANTSLMFNNATSFDQDLSGWDVTSLTNAVSMLNLTTLSTSNYDALLNSWNAQTLQNGVSFHAGNATYCTGEASRTNMIASDSWSITDGGLDCSGANQTPTDIQIDGGNSDTQDENTATNTNIGTLTTTDSDGGDTHTYGLTCAVAGADDAHFNILGDQLRNTSIFDFETNVDANTDGTYEVCIRTTDSGTGNLTYDEIITITINNINLAPTDITIDGANSDSIDENVPASTVVGVLAGTDDDEDTGTLTFALIAGTGDTNNGDFTISGTNLEINASPDFETQSSYSIRVEVSDGTATYEEVLTININDLVENQTPTDIQIDGTNTDSQDENTVTNTNIGTLTTTDLDGGDTHTYGLTCAVAGADDAHFNILGDQLRNATVFDFETPIDANTDGTYEVCIRTTDSAMGNLSYDETITITINDLNNAPTDIAVDGGNIDFQDENTTVNTNISTLTNIDDGEDNTESYTYSLACTVSGADDTHFTILVDQLQNSTVFDFENPVDANTDNTYKICIRVTETNGGLIYDKIITITINDLAESGGSSGGGGSETIVKIGTCSFSGNICENRYPVRDTIQNGETTYTDTVFDTYKDCIKGQGTSGKYACAQNWAMAKGYTLCSSNNQCTAISAPVSAIKETAPEINYTSVPKTEPETQEDLSQERTEEYEPISPILKEIEKKKPEIMVQRAEISKPKICPLYLTDYLKINENNNVEQVRKLQLFLNEFEGFTYLPNTGIFGQQTFNSVVAFQEKYTEDVLTPWDITKGTGWVFQTTKEKINQLWCEQYKTY